MKSKLLLCGIFVLKIINTNFSCVPKWNYLPYIAAKDYTPRNQTWMIDLSMLEKPYAYGGRDNKPLYYGESVRKEVKDQIDLCLHDGANNLEKCKHDVANCVNIPAGSKPSWM